MKMWKRICALSLMASILAAMLPVTALAEEEEPLADAEIVLFEGSSLVEAPEEEPLARVAEDDWRGVWNDENMEIAPGVLEWNTLEVYRKQLSEAGQLIYEAMFAQSKEEYENLKNASKGSMSVKKHFVLYYADDIAEVTIGTNDQKEWEDFREEVNRMEEEDPRDLRGKVGEYYKEASAEIAEEAYRAHMALQNDHPEMPWLQSGSMRVRPYAGVTEDGQTVTIGFTFYLTDHIPAGAPAIEMIRSAEGLRKFNAGIEKAKKRLRGYIG